MSQRQWESMIVAEARGVLKNAKLRVKDLMEWSSAPIAAHDGEIVEYLSQIGVYVAVKVTCDKRAK
mgnify:CR=1 FL=1